MKSSNGSIGRRSKRSTLGRTALHWAVLNGRDGAVRALLAAAAAVDAGNKPSAVAKNTRLPAETVSLWEPKIYHITFRFTVSFSATRVYEIILNILGSDIETYFLSIFILAQK